MYNIIASGSKGNSVLYNQSILVDIGVPYSKIKEFEKLINIVLITHEHKDHINISTLRKLASNRPTLRIGAGKWMKDILSEFKNVDYYDFGVFYDYEIFRIAMGKLYHDVENGFFRIVFENGFKIFHATDTAHLRGITAKNYDLYAIEHNYDEETIEQVIKEKESNGEFAYNKRSFNTHLSEQQAKSFIYENMKTESKVLRLHESSYD